MEFVHRSRYLPTSFEWEPVKLLTVSITESNQRVLPRRGRDQIWPDMREHGAATDDCPRSSKTVLAADILVLAGPIWLGDNSSVIKRVHERLYGGSHLLNDAGRYLCYGRVAGCFITGNEDGIKHCAQNVLYTLQHIGCTIPPQADAGWIGEAGPGPSYLDLGSGEDVGGIPAYGNQGSEWDAGCRFDFENPEYR